jgi:Bacterial archaeo-eukaryotic release factor family 10
VLRSTLTERLRALSDLQAARPVVVSCYLDTGGRNRPRHSDLIQAAEQVVRSVRAEADGLDLSKDERCEVDADLTGFSRAVAELVDRGTTRELVRFSCRSLGLAEELRLPVGIGDRGVLGRRPFLLDLQAALAEDGPVGLVLTGRERTRMALYQLGELQELPEVFDAVPSQTSGGGRAQARLARRADQVAHQHAKRAAEMAFQAFRRVEGLELVLAGQEPAVRDLAVRLRPELADRVVAERRLPLTASTLELSQVLAEVAANRAAARRAELVRRVREEAGSAAVVAGLGPLLDTLRERRLATVVATSTMATPGAACPRCGLLSLALECPACGVATLALDDVVEPALEEALRQGATVLRVPAGAGLEAVGGVGAVLRY